MTAVGELVLLLGLLLAAHCDVRARDPEVEEEEEATAKDSYGGRGGFDHRGVPHGGGYGGHHYINHHHPTRGHGPVDLPGGARLHPGNQRLPHSLGQGQQPAPGQLEEMPVGDGGTGPQSFPARTGNWCAYVHRRVVTMAVSCGTEKYTIKSQSPCPSGSPDCQIIMYKLSTRPVYREKQKIFTALLWRCCPGHGGENCDESVPEDQAPDPQSPTVAGRTHPGGPPAHHSGTQGYPQLIRDPTWEQNDFEVSGSELYEARRTPAENDTSADLTYDYPQSPQTDHDHRQHVYDLGGAVDIELDAHPLPLSPSPGLLALPHLASLIMAQLQPVLDGFNNTLERLSLEVGGLSRDVAELKLRQEETQRERGGEPNFNHETLGHGTGETQGQEYLTSRYDFLERKLEENFQQIEELQRQLDERLHSQHAMLHYNLTNFKADIDAKIKRQQKNLQMNLQALNSSTEELKQTQEHLEEELQRTWETPIERPVIPVQSQPSSSDTAIWEAITRLDEKVVNNTVKVDALSEGLQMTDASVSTLQEDLDELEDKIKATGQRSQVLFMEVGLEVDAARTVVLQRVGELANNLTIQGEQLVELENDIDHLYRQFYANVSSGCNCQASISHLQETISNVNAIANENRLALQSSTHSKPDMLSDWMPSVEDLKQGLGHVQSALAFEQERTRALNSNVSSLQASLLVNQQDIQALQNKEDEKEADVQRLQGSFNSLLKDALRHSEVLEIVLGMEVMEFLDLPKEEQMDNSIPATMKLIRDLKEQLSPADQPSVLANPWTPQGLTKKSEDRDFKDLLYGEPEDGQDYTESDFWSLDKAVEELAYKVRRIEEQPCPASCCNCTKDTATPSSVEGKLQAEVNSLRQGLEDHLQLFKSVFSNTESLKGPEASLDLDKLSAMMQRKEAKQQRRKQRRGSHRAERDASLETTAAQSDNPLAFISSTKSGSSKDGPLIFEDIILDRGQMYSASTGMFRAPVRGLYLFVLTLDFGPGASLARLIRGEGDVAASLHQSQNKPMGPSTRVCLLQLEPGEQLYIELSQGTLEGSNPQDNTFTGLLLYQTT